MSCSVTAKQIDAVLPQTQCGLCGYAGCMPYAEALSKGNATIDLCPPGGVKGLKAIAELLQQDPTPFIEDMEKKAKPKMVARIREIDCIGCTKCIVACPVDAILGGAKQMHVILADECTGCELCVAPCPVDCIEMVGVEGLSEKEEKVKAALARRRFVERNVRINSVETLRPPHPPLRVDLSHEGRGERALEDKRDFIRGALERVREKKFRGK